MTDPTTPQSAPGPEEPVLRRPSTHSRTFQPRLVPQSSSDVILDRNVLRSSAGDTKPQTQRRHEMVGDLPDWQPMPPGELPLRRPRHS